MKDHKIKLNFLFFLWKRKVEFVNVQFNDYDPPFQLNVVQFKLEMYGKNILNSYDALNANNFLRFLVLRLNLIKLNVLSQCQGTLRVKWKRRSQI